MRFQIDERREELKEEKIDYMDLEIIEKTKKYQENYLKNFKEKIFETWSFDETKYHLTSE
jgi:hypothetical protein